MINHVPEVDLGSYEEFFNSDKHEFERYYFSSLRTPPSVDEFDALPAETLRRMRGDFG